MIGYSSSKIKKIYYIEVLILISIAYLLSTGISYFVCHNFVDWFLTNEVFLSLIKVNLNIYLLIATCFINLIIMCLSIFISLKKIDKMEINEILYD